LWPWPLTYKPQYQQSSFSHHQACVYQVSFQSYILFLRYRAETKKVSNFCSIFRSCDLDLCSTILNINRLPPLTTNCMETKKLTPIQYSSYYKPSSTSSQLG
jgi:hypothetical protein